MFLKLSRCALLLAVVMFWSNPARAQSTGPGIGYPSPDAVLQALKARPDVTFFTQGGWTIAADKSSNTIWSFAPANDPAYPTAVERKIRDNAGSIYVDMNILCGGTQAACDKVAADFQTLNDKIKQSAAPKP